MSPSEKIWGGASKVYTTKYDAYKRIVDTDDPHKFARQIDAFHTAAAIGIRLRTIVSPDTAKHREELVNVYSIDPDGVLWAVITALHPEASGAERFDKLMGYADFGIQCLDEEYTIFGNIQASIDSILKPE
jgi:hypothetical protein